MTDMNNTNVNSGVQANIGMEFQKHSTVYLFLEKYEEFKNNRYFIILEHDEDIIFGFLDDKEKLTKIETYQVKKSTNKWTLKGLLEIIKKITATSQLIIDDSHKKTNSFYQKNYFATNNTIDLKCKIPNSKNFVTKTINESNNTISFKGLDPSIKAKICSGNTDIKFNGDNISNLETLYFKYIDLSRTPKSQLEQLSGKFQSVFGESIIDYKAALDTFLRSLRQVESTLNQGNIAKLTDHSKRIESFEINKILNILTTKKLAYDFWRNKGEEIREELNVSIFDSRTFELHYHNSFDKFKDLNEGEHRKIYNFILENKTVFENHSSDKKCIPSFVDEFNRKKTTTLRDLQLKAAISAAYFEVKNSL